MAAGPVGLPVWAEGVWADTVWEEGTWESEGGGEPVSNSGWLIFNLLFYNRRRRR